MTENKNVLGKFVKVSQIEICVIRLYMDIYYDIHKLCNIRL